MSAQPRDLQGPAPLPARTYLGTPAGALSQLDPWWQLVASGLAGSPVCNAALWVPLGRPHSAISRAPWAGPSPRRSPSEVSSKSPRSSAQTSRPQATQDPPPRPRVSIHPRCSRRRFHHFPSHRGTNEGLGIAWPRQGLDSSKDFLCWRRWFALAG